MPASSRLTIKRARNRRRPGSLWSRLPRPRAIAVTCGHVVRRSLPAIAATVVAGALGGGLWLGYRFITTSPRFAITDIAIRGNAKLTTDELLASLPIHVGDNVFASSLANTTRALRENPWVASAEAHRVLPDEIVIELRERTAVAVAELGGLYLVDAEGHPFKRVELDEGAGLPIVTGLPRTAYLADPDATAGLIVESLAAFASWRSTESRPAIGEIHVDAQRTLTLHTYDRAIAIQLGSLDPELPARMHTFDVAWAELSDAERASARAIHLDPRPDHVTVALAKD